MERKGKKRNGKNVKELDETKEEPKSEDFFKKKGKNMNGKKKKGKKRKKGKKKHRKKKIGGQKNNGKKNNG